MGIGLNARIERTWDVATVHAVVWPCGDLDPDRLAAACTAVVRSADPRSYIARRMRHAAAAEGLTVEGFLEHRRDAFVVPVRCRSRPAFLDLLCRRDRGAGGLPFTCVVADGGMGVTYSHELGDGHVLNVLLEALFTAYTDGAPAVSVPSRPVGDGEMLAAFLAGPARRPVRSAGAVLATLRPGHRPPPLRGTGTGGTVRREVVTVSAEELAAVDAWRRDLRPVPSSTVALLWVVSRALREHGQPDPQTWQVMVSLRPAVRGWATAGGNLVGRALVEVSPSTTVAGTGDGIRAGGPELLVEHGLKMARELVRPLGRIRRRRRAANPAVARSTGLSWSDLGRHAGNAVGPLVPTRTRDGGAVRPELVVLAEPYQEGLGTVVSWWGDRATLSMTFGPSALDDDAIDGVLATLRAGVHRLLPDPDPDPSR